MEPDNSYVSYKRDTSLLLYWMVKTSNAIITNLKNSGHSVELEINVTARVSVSDLVPMSQLIAKHRSNVPSTILHLFQSVIRLRSIYYSQFQELAAACPSEELKRNNSTHKYFIDALTSAFEVLGGEKWRSEEREKRTRNDGEDERDANTFAFENRFSLLDLESGSENDDALDVDREESDAQNAPSHKKRKLRKGKKRVKGKRVKGKKAQRDCKSSQSNGKALDIALENYHIIEFEFGDIMAYSMAFVPVIRDMIQFRLFLQDVWRKVAYRNLNSAVAAAISNIAVAMIKQSETAIFIAFPGFESYEKVTQAIMLGENEISNGEILCNDRAEIPGDTKPTLLDKKELFLIHTYKDLVDFITDYQKTRRGKPTKSMLAQIDNWNPNLDLQKATKEERIKWRRSYTINWLYDLVNMTACVALYEKRAKKETHVLEQMDWSDQGPFKSYRRMYGLTNFAAAVTTLAMQKQGTDFRHKILPHLVFHLQCIVDAWTVSRGWAIGWVKDHILSEPAQSFQPRRDLDFFLGCEKWERKGVGYFLSLDFLTAAHRNSKKDGKGLERMKDRIWILEQLGVEFRDTLGKCKIFQSHSAFLPSRFASTNHNGAWDYSPFFCGAGLAEGLELFYRSVMVMWERMVDPMLIMHLHNMLVQEGYLEQAVPLYSCLERSFSDSFFSGGQSPTSDYVGALRSRLDKAFYVQHNKGGSQKAANSRAVGQATNARDLLDMIPLRLFKQKSSLLMYRSADWNPTRVLENDVEPLSALGQVRLSQTRRVRDRATSVWRLEETDFVKRARAAGIDESFYMKKLSPMFEEFKDERQAQMDTMRSVQTRASEINHTYKASKKGESSFVTSRNEMTAERMLAILYEDIHGDICGSRRPLSSLCYIGITIQMLLYFDELMLELQKSNNTSFNRIFASDAASDGQCNLTSYKRLQITLDALGGKDTELLSSMAQVFETQRGQRFPVKHWDAEDDETESNCGPVMETSSPDCCIM